MLCLLLHNEMQAVVIKFIPVDTVSGCGFKSFSLFQIEDFISQFEGGLHFFRRIRKLDSVLILLCQNRRIAKFIT